MEGEDGFDPSLLKKKKKKKTTFDLDAALGLDDSAKKEDLIDESAVDATAADLDDNLDLESFGKKKKKKKKPFNLDELEGALPEGGGADDIVIADDPEEEEINLDMDFSMAKKKKRSKKKDLDELFADKMDEDKGEDKENVDDSSSTWAGSDRDYTYDELLKRVFEIILDKNPDMAGGRKPKFVMRPPQVLRVGTKKTSFANFMDIAKTLHRLPKHLLDFLLAELGTSGSMDGNQQLIIKGRFQPKQIENVLRRYIKEYVTCHTCRSPETILQKDTRLFFLQCESCGSRCSVASIKSGFQAVTGKRAAIRAKTT
ncbi:eukaryotic translation initiation factor 2 subunit 2 [Drosophila grimshawi]|uniref:Eukaryotic translation initiation factor 2 subunit 2 n=1 Tax=Drosophila grimshawi TaxID=7222 RepID=B4IX70_DROGR|nr:eukaryotic translation initiation factor 2 subunit 2 [Drosophila grimshawi]EDV97402.1 GH16843 [Drosophila grimshawi]